MSVCEAEWLRRYIDGEQAALSQLINRFRDPLIRFLFNYLKNEAEAEDIAAEVLAELALHPERYRGTVTLKTYLFMLAKSRALNRMRRRSFRLTIGLDDAPTLTDCADTPEEHLLRSERQKEVRAALRRIKDDYRTVLHLIYVEELSYEEAGHVLGKSRKQIENLVYRAKQAAKNEMDPS